MIRLEYRLDAADDEIVVRIDSSSFRNVRTTPQGFLRMPIHATRVGVFTYRNPDGTVRRELRHPDDVFDPKSLATLAGIPIIDDHPNVKNPNVMMIDAKNTREHIIGYTGDGITADGEYVAGEATIYDDTAISKIRQGKEELSCGYACERESAPGVWNGLAYDVRQRNIVYNHLALVDRGRAGPNVRLRLDSADAVQVDFITPEVMEMEKILINGVEYEVTKAVADAYNAEQGVIASAKKAASDSKVALDSAVKRADTAEARADSLTGELTKAKEQLSVRVDAADPKVVRSAAKKTMRLLKVADRVLPKATLDKIDEMDDLAIMREVIKAESPNFDLTGKSDTYVEVRFDTIEESLAADKSKSKERGKEVREGRSDAAEYDAEAARQRQKDESRDAWKTPAK